MILVGKAAFTMGVNPLKYLTLFAAAALLLPDLPYAGLITFTQVYGQ